LVASRDLNELRRLMPTTMIEMMLTLDPVMYIMKPCIASVLAGDCAIPMAICDGMVVGEGSEGEGTWTVKKEGRGASSLLEWSGLKKRSPPRATQPN
jgi:hypothetical protein